MSALEADLIAMGTSTINAEHVLWDDRSCHQYIHAFRLLQHITLAILLDTPSRDELLGFLDLF